MIKNVFCSSCKVTAILVRFFKLEFSTKSLEKLIFNFMESSPVSAKFVRAVGRKDGQARESFTRKLLKKQRVVCD